MVYVVGFSNADMLSERIGMPKLVTVAVGLLLAALLLGFILMLAMTHYLG